MKVCWVSIIGRPNTGKSTLLNKIIKYDLSIISPIAQTTRDNINGIYTDDEYQIIFFDTPGIHKAHSIFGENLNKKALNSIKESDLVLFLNPINEEISTGDKLIIEKLRPIKNKIAVITKSDLKKDQTKTITKINILKNFGFNNIQIISSLNENSINNLLNEIKKFANDDIKYFDDDYITDKTELFLSKEIIRNSAIKYLKDELPHSIAVEIINYHIDEVKNKKIIDAIIYCKKESQKGILIGKNGSMIKKIGTDARKQIINKFSYTVQLNLYVKINHNWMNNKKMIKRFGY